MIARRAAETAAPVRRRRMPKQSPPTAAMVELGRGLAVIARRAVAVFGSKLVGLPEALAAGDRTMARTFVDRADAAARALISSGVVTDVAARGARLAADWNAAQLAKQIEAGLGIPARSVPIAPAASARLYAFGAVIVDRLGAIVDDLERAARRLVASEIREDAEAPIEHAIAHAALIEDLSVQEKELLAGFMTAQHAAGELSNRQRGAVVGFLRERLGMGEKRAKWIARDQTAKLVGMVNRDRQLALGITEFYWRTRHDHRVRPTHRARRDKVFRWDRPPGGEFPGISHGCRCSADAKLDDIRKISEELRSQLYAFSSVRRFI